MRRHPDLGCGEFFLFLLPDTHNGRPSGRLYPTKRTKKRRKTPKKGQKRHLARRKREKKGLEGVGKGDGGAGVEGFGTGGGGTVLGEIGGFWAEVGGF